MLDTALFDASEARRQVTLAGEFLFETELVREFLSLRVVAGKKSEPLPSEWGPKMAEPLALSRPFANFARGYIRIAHANMWKDDPEEARQRFVSRGIQAGPGSSESLAHMHRQLAAKPDHPNWITVLYVSLGRMLATTATATFGANEWTEGGMEMMKAEGQFVDGQGKAFAKLICSSKVISVEVLQEHLAAGASLALATMVLAKPDSAFFHH